MAARRSRRVDCPLAASGVAARRRAAALTLAALTAIAGLTLTVVPALAAGAQVVPNPVPPLGSTSTTSSTTSTTLPPPTVPPGPPPPKPVVVAPGPNSLSQQNSEVGAAEAQLLSLIDTVNARLAGLAGQLQTLDKDLATNQASLDAANQLLAKRQADVTAANIRVVGIQLDMAAAKAEMQQRAVAAYINQPTGQLINLFLHLRDPAELNDVHAFYQALVDAQVKTVERYDRLKKEAVKAAKAAATARDVAAKQQKVVADQKVILTSIRTTLALVQRESTDEQAQQQALQGQANAQKTAFEQAVQQLQTESDAVAALLRNLSDSGGPSVAAANGLLAIPIPGAVITSPFGPRIDPVTGAIGFHPGVDFGARYGVPIEAAADGIVVWAGPNGGYGNCTIIDHGYGLATLYAHQSNIIVKVGDTVTRGQVIGQVGSTGYSTGPHLHFEVRVHGNPVDPLPYL